MKALQTYLIDFGFIHCIDEPADLRSIEKAGIIRYIEKLKEKGVVRHIGLSCHTPELVNEVLDMGILDIRMFSINPAYDYAGGELDYAADTVTRGARSMWIRWRECRRLHLIFPISNLLRKYR